VLTCTLTADVPIAYCTTEYFEATLVFFGSETTTGHFSLSEKLQPLFQSFLLSQANDPWTLVSFRVISLHTVRDQ